MTIQAGSIAVRHLSKRYSGPDGREQAVLRDLDFAVAPGEFLCLLGPSGCGKSTLLRLLCGLESPDQGSLSCHPVGARTAMVFQQAGLFPWMSLLNNLRFVMDSQPHLQGEDTDARAQQLLAQVGLGDYADHYPQQVSGGMQQRLAVARSFAIEPDILLMDEPFVHLDYQTRWQLQQMLLRLWQEQQTTVVFVTHDAEEAILLGDRIRVMSSRPARLVADIPVDLPRPRQLTGLKGEARFHQLCAEVIGLIHHDMEQDVPCPAG